MAKPLPSRADQEAFIRAYAGQPIPLSQLGPASLQRAYNYARGAEARGEPFDYGRATGHPPKIEHHHYEGVQQKGLRIPMLEDWYIGECERPPVLADVTRLLNHAENKGAEFLSLAFIGFVEYPDGHQEPDATSNAVSRADLVAAIKRVKNIYELYSLLNPDTELDGTPPPLKIICQISMRPAIERGGLAKLTPPPEKPKPPVVKPLSKTKRAALQKGLRKRKKL